MDKRKKKCQTNAARPVIAELPTHFSKAKGTNVFNEKEFQRLLDKSPVKHKERTLKLLNTLFNQDITSKEVVLLVQNNSDCNMILKVQGKKFYNLAIPAHGENTLVVDKGNYRLKSSICDLPLYF